MASKPVAEFAARTAIGPFGSRMKSDLYTDSGVPVIRGTNLTGGKVLSGDWVYVSDKTADDLSNCCVYPGDLVFPHRGAIGEVGIVPDQFPRYVMSSSMMTLSCDRSKARPDYVYYFFKSAAGRHELLKNASQVGTPGIGQPLSTLRAIEVPLPPPSSQFVIAKTLGDLDSKIDLNRRINQTLEAMAQALFKSWFVDFDPVKAKIFAIQEGRDPLRAAMSAISGKPDAELDALSREQFSKLAATAALFPEEMELSELGEVPRGWRMSNIGEVCRAHGGLIQTGPFGSQLHASDYLDKGIPVVMPQDLSGRRIQATRVARISEMDAERLKRHRIQPGDIIFSRRGDVGRHALVSEIEKGWLCGTGCLLVRPSKKAEISAYVSCALARDEALDWLVRHAVGATMPNLNTGILSELPILMPLMDLIDCFCALIGPINEKVNRCQAEVEILGTLRDTLLPKLLSGELSVAEAIAESET